MKPQLLPVAAVFR